MKDTRVDIYHGVTPIKVKPYEHNVKYYETDQMGIVHHSNYIRWFESARIDYMDQMGPVALMLIGMPISGSIGHGIGLGLISYSVLKLCTGKGKDVSVLTYVISVIFLVKFFLVA